MNAHEFMNTHHAQLEHRLGIQREVRYQTDVISGYGRLFNIWGKDRVFVDALIQDVIEHYTEETGEALLWPGDNDEIEGIAFGWAMAYSYCRWDHPYHFATVRVKETSTLRDMSLTDNGSFTYWERFIASVSPDPHQHEAAASEVLDSYPETIHGWYEFKNAYAELYPSKPLGADLSATVYLLDTVHLEKDGV